MRPLACYSVPIREENGHGWQQHPPEVRLVNRKRMNWIGEMPPEQPCATHTERRPAKLPANPKSLGRISNPDLDRLLECALFVVGLAFGSFLNVCISRIPRDESIVSPPSHCPYCGAAIRWYDNIPLLSWIILRGRCRNCRQRISLRYPAVELLTGLAFLDACYAHSGSLG